MDNFKRIDGYRMDVLPPQRKHDPEQDQGGQAFLRMTNVRSGYGAFIGPAQFGDVKWTSPAKRPVANFDEAIRRAHVRQVQASMRVMKWVIFGGMALGMALAAWVMGGV